MKKTIVQFFLAEHGARNWKLISKLAFIGARTDVQCLHRWQKVLRPGLVKGPWTKVGGYRFIYVLCMYIYIYNT